MLLIVLRHLGACAAAPAAGQVTHGDRSSCGSGGGPPGARLRASAALPRLRQHHKRSRSFCLDCWRELRFLGEPCCARCALPFDYDHGREAECGACLQHPPGYDRLRAAVAYGQTARKVALKLKYGGRPSVAETMAGFMQRHLIDEPQTSILVPVPLHRWRIWKRGYNQSALVARALARRTGLPVELDWLRRVKATPPLRGFGRRERALAVSGAFKVPDGVRPLLQGRDIMLVDDVYTSGATVGACAKALKRAGAGRVSIICWARVLNPAQD
jgi:ComF family protein